MFCLYASKGYGRRVIRFRLWLYYQLNICSRVPHKYKFYTFGESKFLGHGIDGT